MRRITRPHTPENRIVCDLQQHGYRSPSSLLAELSPYDFALFPKFKMKLKGQHFETVSDIQRKSQAVLNNIKENDFHGAFEAWKKRLDCCIGSQGDYFGGDGSQN
jgi:hypothetical protein